MSRNMWFWWAQRISAIALIALLAVHLWVLHFSHPESTVTLGNVHQRLNTFRFLLVDYLLLFMALFHGLNGVRNILLDHSRFASRSRTITWALTVVGMVFCVYGGAALWYASQFVSL
ncbi:MAG: hypothetical protein K6T81_15675 [Alicyclobacillus macrosporangiidus]|uniref:hypothetical protein n=1 Tax=Alicyclobacillus macrosporangiidus TaxID=392015 RepID=UPI0026EC501E|nr:hypothetical protein [Alicyclobacillus macrosporangiidus]MCL6600157.1 hypothetical protein [Alicyclobacillus macrosporangiidus]